MAKMKKFDEWVFRVEAQQHRVNVYRAKGEYDRDILVAHEAAHDKDGRCTGASARDTDISKLRRSIEDKLRDCYAVAWTRVLNVKVSGGGGFVDAADVQQWVDRALLGPDEFESYMECKGNISLEIDPMAIGKNSAGVTLTKRSESDTPYPEHAVRQRQGVPHATGTSEQWARISDTPESRKALAEILDAMKLLRVKLYTLLSQDQAEKSLAMIAAGRPLLTAPNERAT